MKQEPVSNNNSVRRIILMGVFWRILIIEALLLVGTLVYASVTEHKSAVDLMWYALRIISLVAIIIMFMTVTLSSFLNEKIILPLEAIVEANQKMRNSGASYVKVELSKDLPKEIYDIVSSRNKMLETILTVSEERLSLVQFIKKTFGQYLSNKIVDQILSSPEGTKIGGQLKTVTVLMSDLRGFTTLSESTDPENLVLILNRYLKYMSEIIVAHDGIIDEFIGDAILTVFGVPETHKEDPFRAVACAIAMQNRLDQLNQELSEEGFPVLEMGIGINTGPAVVGNIGSEIRTKYGIVGPTINIASRIESNTVGGEVLIGESTYDIVKDHISYCSPQTVMMKGIKKPLVIISVTAIHWPFEAALQIKQPSGAGAPIQLPFVCQAIKDKKLIGPAIEGETISIDETLFFVNACDAMDPFTDIRLKFNFCIDAHCFDDIYLKVLPPEVDDQPKHCRLRVTSMSDKDKILIKKWVEDAV